jgi:hypothetical protein
VTGEVANLRVALLMGMCLALLAGATCKRHSQTQPTPFPASNEVASWEKTGEMRTFPAADLWKYIDGEAERYLKAGVQTVSTSDYKFQGKFDAVVDVYTMETAAGANQIVESEPLGDARLVAIGDGARLYKKSLVFRKGPYLVRITAYDDSAEIQQALLGLGRGIDKRLAK